MKTKHYALTLLLAILLTTTFTARVSAQTRPYNTGHVFTFSMIRILPGQTDDYITSLKNNLKLVNDEAIKEGLLVSSRQFIGEASSQGDYNFLIIDEFADANSAYGNLDKWDAIQAKVVGDNTAMKGIMSTRTAQREILGSKTMQEVIYK